MGSGDDRFDFDFIVIGSGFGGSVSALRLSEKGYRVAVIEMGRRWAPQSFPRTSWSIHRWFWRPKLGLQSVVWNEAVKINGADPDFHRRDLWEAIEAGEYPEWELGLQVFTEEQGEAFSFDILDATKIVPEELVPIQPVGRMVLNRNPDNFFAETEQVAFCPANMIPGIDFSNDPLLQGRLFSYLDTQLSRLGGTNFHQIPINAPKCPFANHQRDAHMQMQVPKGRVNYEPNSLDADSAAHILLPREVPHSIVIDPHKHGLQPYGCGCVLFRDPSVGVEPFLSFTSGYVQRAIDRLPKQGTRRPWQVHQNYFSDMLALRFGRIDDGVLLLGTRYYASAQGNNNILPGSGRTIRFSITAGREP